MRILIVAPNISRRMGGEAALAYNYMQEFQRLGLEVAALSHARVREELRESPIWREGAFFFVEDAKLEQGLHRIGRRLPSAIGDTVFNSAISAVTLKRLATRARALAREIGADVIHQPAPVSPQLPSFLHDMSAPVVIGPLNGGMDYPPAFARAYSRGSQAAAKAARAASGVLNALIPGKRDADRVLVANERTRRALPKGVENTRIEILVENGVDLRLWPPKPQPRPATPVFVFVGRLVWWKAVELLIDAFSQLETPARLLIIGDGEERARLEARAKASHSAERPIEFCGFLPQAEIARILAASTALVLPSLRECGGAVILEAFACHIPAIATDWGGPRDYITPETGLLVPPGNERGFVARLSAAMSELAADPARARAMGEAARRRVEENFSWAAKAKAMLAVYERAREEREKSRRAS